jgi:hypothetical protein
MRVIWVLVNVNISYRIPARRNERELYRIVRVYPQYVGMPGASRTALIVPIPFVTK